MSHIEIGRINPEGVTQAHPSPRRALARRLRLWVAVATQRRDLARLEDHELADIGVTRAQAASEARRPFWDL